MITVTITRLRRNDYDQKSVMLTHRRKKVARAMPPRSATRVYGSNTGGQQWPYPSEAAPSSCRASPSTAAAMVMGTAASCRE